MTTRETITKWLKEGEEEKDITHMIVVWDTFSYEEYLIYVRSHEDIHEIYAEYEGKNMLEVMEVYSFKQDLEKQLNERRAFHFD